MIKYNLQRESARPVVHTRLLKAMQETGLGYEELAKVSGVTRRTIYAILYGDARAPRVDTVILLAKALDKPLDYLYPIHEERLKAPC